MTDHQKRIIGTVLMNVDPSSTPISEEMIDKLVSVYDSTNAMMFGVPHLTEAERTEVIAELHSTLLVTIENKKREALE